jgi:hypothetical protein
MTPPDDQRARHHDPAVKVRRLTLFRRTPPPDSHPTHMVVALVGVAIALVVLGLTVVYLVHWTR